MLLWISFDRVEAAKLLSTLTGSCPAQSLHVGVIYRRLATLTQENPQAATVLERTLTRKHGQRNLCSPACPMFEVACIWSTQKDTMDRDTAAALLWRVIRSGAHWWRQLERAMVDDLQYLANHGHRSALPFGATARSS